MHGYSYFVNLLHLSCQNLTMVSKVENAIKKRIQHVTCNISKALEQGNGKLMGNENEKVENKNVTHNIPWRQ